jgi:hypothetical protein
MLVPQPSLVLGEFESGDALLAAARALREAGVTQIDLHSPYALEGADEALGLARSRVPLWTLVGGLTGASLGYLTQLYCNAVDFPLNVGGRPPHAPPSFVPITFELGVLFAAFGTLLSMLAACGFPRPYHASQKVDAFRSATLDGFWMTLLAPQGRDQAEALHRRLIGLGARHVTLVEDDDP